MGFQRLFPSFPVPHVGHYVPVGKIPVLVLKWVLVGARYADAFVVIYTADPVNPTQVGYLIRTEFDYALYTEVIDENTAFLTAEMADTVNTIDITDKTAPSLIDSLTTVQLDYVAEVSMMLPYAVCVSSETDGPVIIDCSNVAALVQVGYLSSTAMIDAHAVFVSDYYAYVAAVTSDSLTIVDVSDPTAPVQVSSITDPSLDAARGVVVSGNYAFVSGAGADSLVVIDVSDKANPVIVGTLTTAQLDACFGISYVLDYCYIAATLADALTIVDVSNKVSPVQTGYVTDPSLDGAVDVEVYKPTSAVTGRLADSVCTIDVTDPAAPSLLGTVTTTQLDDVWGIKGVIG